MPAVLQVIGLWGRPTAFIEKARARYGSRFTIRLPGQPPWVVLSDPAELKELFLAPPETLHAGEGTKVLEPIVGRFAVGLLDEGPHLRQRRLMLPAFHAERMRRLADLVADSAEREVALWPRDQMIVLHGRLQRLTLEIILRAVFGLEPGAGMSELHGLLTDFLAFGQSPLAVLPPPLLRVVADRGQAGGRKPRARLGRLGAQIDARIYELIDERRRTGSAGEDLFSVLLAAKHEDGSLATREELRDELIGALVAGRITTATQLAWAFERLAREPSVLARIYKELDASDGDAYLTATVQEVLRHRPVLPESKPRMVKRPVRIGGFDYSAGAVLIANAYLLHHDPAIYPEPYTFRPERFLERPPGTYTWIPFGGGRRRCLGANLAMLEMKTVLRAVLGRYELHPAGGGAEAIRRRGVTISPARHCQVVLRERFPGRAPSGSAAPAQTVATAAGAKAA